MPSIIETYGFSNMRNLLALTEAQRPARVISAANNLCRVIFEEGEALASFGKGIGAPGWEDGVCAGDWVALHTAEGEHTVEAIYPRKSAFRRTSTQIGVAHAQIVAANIELVLIVTSANKEYRAARVERYLSAAWDSGAQPVVILTKCDLHPEPERILAEIERIAPGAEVFGVSSVTGFGVEALRKRLAGVTSALIGSSGVGKSTLINAFAGQEIMRTQEIREDDSKGRHTTTHRELLLVGDVMIIDTPGMRALGLWESENIDNTFSDIAELAGQCRFRDCRHKQEPGCAVKAAVNDGRLEERRLRSYLRMTESNYIRKRRGNG